MKPCFKSFVIDPGYKIWFLSLHVELLGNHARFIIFVTIAEDNA